MERVAREVLTTFATSYTAEVSMSQAVTIDALREYGKQATGKKYLLNPSAAAGPFAKL
jgi:NADPH2:quinone reductase